MKYAHYDALTKQLTGYYDDGVHDTIPTPNIHLSEEAWQNAIDSGLNSIDTETSTLFFKDFRTEAEIQENTLAQFKSIYLSIIDDKLKELDYDSLTTVKLWEGDATYGAEASKIIDWYKSIIAYNYVLHNSGEPYPTEEEYVAGMPIYV